MFAQVIVVVFVVVTGLAILSVLTSRGFRRVSRLLEHDPSVIWPAPAHPEIVVTLIHGTWARSATWVLPNSPLSAALVSAWGDRIALLPFVWSGGNTLRAREHAASALRQHIGKVAARYPDAAHYLLAHSHGGNIALYALGEQATARRVHGLACLSTPFLHLRRRRLGRITVSSIVAGVVVWMIGSVSVLGQSLLGLSEDAAGLTAVVTTATVVTAMVRFSRKATETILKRFSLPQTAPTSLLLIRATGDEATSALAAVHFGSWLARRLWDYPAGLMRDASTTIERWRPVARRIVIWLLLPTIVAVIAAFQFKSPAADSTALAAAVRSIAIGLTLVQITALATWWIAAGGTIYHYVIPLMLAGLLTGPLPLLLALLISPFGPGLALTCVQIEVTAEATPPGTHTVHHLPEARIADAGEGFELDHSRSYNDPAAIAIIVNWLRGKTGQM